jgi:hypothetical protein
VGRASTRCARTQAPTLRACRIVGSCAHGGPADTSLRRSACYYYAHSAYALAFECLDAFSPRLSGRGLLQGLPNIQYDLQGGSGGARVALLAPHGCCTGRCACGQRCLAWTTSHMDGVPCGRRLLRPLWTAPPGMGARCADCIAGQMLAMLAMLAQQRRRGAVST